jgi:hypothetical protein
MAPVKDERIYLRVNSRMKQQAEAYARRKHTTLSTLVTRFLKNLLEYERQVPHTKDKVA